LLDEVLERRPRNHARASEDQHLIAEDHQRRDGPDLERGGQLLLDVRIDLAEHDVRILVTGLLVDWREGAAGAAPTGPPVDRSDPRLLAVFLKILRSGLHRRHVFPVSFAPVYRWMPLPLRALRMPS